MYFFGLAIVTTAVSFEYNTAWLLRKELYGLISLYHTMIPPLRDAKYENVRQLSAQILNFPVHPDVTEEQILNMYDALMKLL